MNCNGTRIGLIGSSGVLKIFEIKDKSEHFLDFVRKDTWLMRFADDDPLLFVYMEKEKVFIVNDIESEPMI